MNYSNHRILHFIFIICLFLISSASVFSQQSHGKIKGIITTSDGDPAAGVNIILKNSKYSTISNEYGAFEFNRVKPNTYILQISLTGYETLTQDVTVAENQTATAQLHLTISNKQLKEVIITSSRGKAFPKQSVYVSKMPLKNIENPQVYNVVSSEIMKE